VSGDRCLPRNGRPGPARRQTLGAHLGHVSLVVLDSIDGTAGVGEEEAHCGLEVKIRSPPSRCAELGHDPLDRHLEGAIETVVLPELHGPTFRWLLFWAMGSPEVWKLQTYGPPEFGLAFALKQVFFGE